MSFWDIIWFILISFAFVAYLMVMFTIITDLFRDRDAPGWQKAVWVLALIFFPFVTALVYLIVKGDGVAERQAAAADRSRQAQEEYVRSLAGSTSPVDEIARAKELLDAGAISDAEFQAIKARALA